jgi:hypothetical protein
MNNRYRAILEYINSLDYIEQDAFYGWYKAAVMRVDKNQPQPAFSSVASLRRLEAAVCLWINNHLEDDTVNMITHDFGYYDFQRMKALATA